MQSETETSEYRIEAAPEPITARSLIDQERALTQQKAGVITALLKEREQLNKHTAERLVGIAGELKALGWHRAKAAKGTVATAPKAPRKPRQKKVPSAPPA